MATRADLTPLPRSRSAMLWVHAYLHGLDVPEQRHAFKATSFSHALSADRRSGTVTLRPKGQVLTVGSEAHDFQCVRIFDEDGRALGTMSRSPAGEVIWRSS